MKKKSLKAGLAGLTILPAVLLCSCEKAQLGENTPDNQEISTQNAAVLKAAGDVQGRNLAANCFQCHGTNGYAGELKIAGQGSSEIVSKLTDMKSKPVGENIMNVHARAYTDAELKLIGDFISKQ
jgi:cytochrome subunit of sulfide dehydrogenase